MLRSGQKYCERLTTRRNEALKKRKILKESKEIVSAYVAYPAVLMIKQAE